MDISTYALKGSRKFTFRAVVPEECMKDDQSIRVLFFLLQNGAHILNLESHVR